MNIENISLNFGPFGVGGVSLERCEFPEIWPNSDYGYAGVDFIFSGYYTVANDKDWGEDVVDGEIKLIRTRDEDVQRIKEILCFTIKKGSIVGKIQYKRYTSESFEESDPEIIKGSWIEESSITAFASNLQPGQHYYKNIKFVEKTSDENGNLLTYVIEQKSGPDISLNYFKSLIVLNSLQPDEKPIVKKIKRD